MDKQQFWDVYVPPKIKNTIKGGTGVAYAMAVLSLLVEFRAQSKWLILFAALFAVFGAGVQFFKSRICAVGLVVTVIPWAMFFVPAELARPRRHGRHRYTRPELFVALAAITFVMLAIDIFKYHKLKAEYENGTLEVSQDFKNVNLPSQFEGYRTPQAPPTQQVPQSYGMEQMPSYSQADSDYSYGSQPAQDEYKEAWEMEDINTDKR